MQSDKELLKVYEIMSSPVVTAKADSSLQNIALKMKRKGIGAVVVLDGARKVAGIVTQGDIVRRFASKTGKTLHRLKAKDIMKTPIITIGHEVDIEEAARTMVKHKIKRLCVVDGKEKLVGIISDNDIMKNSEYLIGVFKEMINSGYVRS